MIKSNIPENIAKSLDAILTYICDTEDPDEYPDASEGPEGHLLSHVDAVGAWLDASRRENSTPPIIHVPKWKIQKHFVCSTGHITESDNALLEGWAPDFEDLMVDDFDHGWRIHVTIEGKEKGQREFLLKDGFSPEFCNLVEIARSLYCECLCLDRDGPEYPELKIFEW
jgi:hypothetical protein